KCINSKNIDRIIKQGNFTQISLADLQFLLFNFTFKLPSKKFKQCMIIMFYYDRTSKYVTLVYEVLENRNSLTY
ncbi:hypothetical protein MXB_1362, partial [Myxobolus squamalis]